jgi:hypothetical protein
MTAPWTVAVSRPSPPQANFLTTALGAVWPGGRGALTTTTTAYVYTDDAFREAIDAFAKAYAAGVPEIVWQPIVASALSRYFDGMVTSAIAGAVDPAKAMTLQSPHDYYARKRAG